MAIRKIALSAFLVNRANDRHGELENETAAIAWLFNNREVHMRNLAKDIVAKGQIYELPLVAPEGTKYIVFDGNRRVTCLKLLDDPRRHRRQNCKASSEISARTGRGRFRKKFSAKSK